VNDEFDIELFVVYQQTLHKRAVKAGWLDMEVQIGSRRQAALCAAVVCAVCLAGCTGSDALKSATAARLKGLATMYLDYAAAKGGGPPNEEAFKKHMRTVEKFVLQGNGVDTNAIDAAFVSERDKEPFVVLYNVGISHISGNSAPLVAYEKTGVGGKRLVAFANTKLDHVDEAKLKELMTAKK